MLKPACKGSTIWYILTITPWKMESYYENKLQYLLNYFCSLSYAAAGHWKSINCLNSGNNGNTSTALYDCCQAVQKSFSGQSTLSTSVQQTRKSSPQCLPHRGVTSPLMYLGGPSSTSMTRLQCLYSTARCTKSFWRVTMPLVCQR